MPAGQGNQGFARRAAEKKSGRGFSAEAKDGGRRETVRGRALGSLAGEASLAAALHIAAGQAEWGRQEGCQTTQ